MSTHTDYWRRRDEQYWRSKDDGRRVFAERTRSIRETGKAGRRHRLNAEYLAGEIKHREDSAKAARHLEVIRGERAFILNQMSICEAARADWHERLGNIDLTGPGAVGQLQGLLQDVERNQIVWSKLPELPMVARHVTSLTPPLPELSDVRPGRAPFAVNAVELRSQREEEQRELRRRLNETALGLIASSLSLLITQVRAYRSGSF
jgi:hypothetical protein